MPNGLEGKVATAAARPGCRAILVVLDGEGDSVCRLGPQLLRRINSVLAVPAAVALADTKFETWIVASAETLSLPGVVFPTITDPERAIKEALRPVKYVKPVWQPRLTQLIDLELACSRDSSLARLLARFDDLVVALEPSKAPRRQGDQRDLVTPSIRQSGGRRRRNS